LQLWSTQSIASSSEEDRATALATYRKCGKAHLPGFRNMSVDRRTQGETGTLVTIFSTLSPGEVITNKKFQTNLGRAASPPLTVMAENNYTTNGTIGCPKLTPKLSLPFDDLHSHLIRPSLDQPHLPPKRHPDPISRFPQYTLDRHRPTNKPTDGWAR